MEHTNLGESTTIDNFKEKSLISSLLNYIASQVSKLSIKNIKEGIRTPSLKRRKMPWWIEIKTHQPYCIYYFGPFNTIGQARRDRDGYIEDLVEEKAYGITVDIKQCSPNILTIFED